MRLTFRSKAAESSSYRPDIDGLRAVAVLSVVLFHAHIPGFPGGFVGVDVFFVISGYLITTILENDLLKGRFSFRTFYERRVRRIFPALVVMLLAVLGVGVVLFPPTQFSEFGRSLLSVALFISNIHFRSIGHTTGYFSGSSTDHYLLHTWSLSVEEQFYLLFPVLLLLVHRYAGAYKRAAFFVLAVASFAASVWAVRYTPVQAFYLLPGRGWELLVGSLLAFKPLPALGHRVAREAASFAGLAGIVYAVATYTDATPFPGAHALLPCLGAGLILYAGEAGPSAASWVLSLSPLVFVGTISYSLYLWHWPLLDINQFLEAHVPAPREQIAPLLLAVLLAFLSFEFVETPFRTRSKTPRGTWRALGTAVAVNAAFVVMGFAIVHMHGVPRRFSQPKAEALDRNFAMKEEQPIYEECVGNVSVAPFKMCEFGSSPKKALFMGDSHLGNIYPLILELYKDRPFEARGALVTIAPGCAPVQGLYLPAIGPECEDRSRYALERARNADVDTVFIAFSPWWAMYDGQACSLSNGHCGRPLTRAAAWGFFLKQMDNQIRDLRAHGKRVIVSVPTPLWSLSIPDAEIRNLVAEHFKVAPIWPFDLLAPDIPVDTRAMAVRAGAEVYDSRYVLCGNSYCTYQIDNVSLFIDHGHISRSQTWFLRPSFRKALAQPPTQPPSDTPRSFTQALNTH